MSDDDLLKLARGMAKRYRIKGWTTHELSQEFVTVALESRRKDPHPGSVTRDIFDHARGLIIKARETPTPFTDLAARVSFSLDLPPDAFAIETSVYPHLDPDERMVVELSYRDGLTDKEIGRVLGKSQDAVESWRRRILEKLRRKIDPPIDIS